MQINYIRLELLLKNMGITSKELSNAIHVDYSLVSKWKNGSRKLTMQSPHFDNIIDFMIEFNKPLLTTQMTVLSIISGNEPIPTESLLKKTLIAWLTAPDNTSSIVNFNQSNNSYSAIYTVYIGNVGKRAAITRLLDTALALPDHQTLDIYVYEDKSWLIEDKDFLNVFKEKIIQLVEKKCTIHVLRVIDSHSIHEMCSLDNELFFKYTNYIHNSYLPFYSGLLMNCSLYVLEGHAAITSFSCPLCETSYNFFVDPFSLQLYSNIYTTLLSKSNPLLFPFGFSTFESVPKEIRQIYQQAHNSVTICKSGLSMLLLPRELLIEILNENNVLYEMIGRICFIYDHLSNFDEGVSTLILFCHDLLNKGFDFDNLCIYDLSILLGNKIYLSRHQFKIYMKNILDTLLEVTGFEVGFCPPNNDIFHQNMNISIIENCIILLSDISNSRPVGSLIEEPLFVHNYNNIYHDIWNSISLPYRSKEYVIPTIRNLIETI